MENKKKSHRENIRDFCKQEIDRTIDEKISNIVVQHVQEEYESFWFMVLSWCLRIGAAYGFYKFSIISYEYVYELYNTFPL